MASVINNAMRPDIDTSDLDKFATTLEAERVKKKELGQDLMKTAMYSNDTKLFKEGYKLAYGKNWDDEHKPGNGAPVPDLDSGIKSGILTSLSPEEVKQGIEKEATIKGFRDSFGITKGEETAKNLNLNSPAQVYDEKEINRWNAFLQSPVKLTPQEEAQLSAKSIIDRQGPALQGGMNVSNPEELRARIEKQSAINGGANSPLTSLIPGREGAVKDWSSPSIMGAIPKTPIGRTDYGVIDKSQSPLVETPYLPTTGVVDLSKLKDNSAEETARLKAAANKHIPGMTDEANKLINAEQNKILSEYNQQNQDYLKNLMSYDDSGDSPLPYQRYANKLRKVQEWEDKNMSRAQTDREKAFIRDKGNMAREEVEQQYGYLFRTFQDKGKNPWLELEKKRGSGGAPDYKYRVTNPKDPNDSTLVTANEVDRYRKMKWKIDKEATQTEADKAKTLADLKLKIDELQDGDPAKDALMSQYEGVLRSFKGKEYVIAGDQPKNFPLQGIKIKENDSSDSPGKSVSNTPVIKPPPAAPPPQIKVNGELYNYRGMNNGKPVYRSGSGKTVKYDVDTKSVQ